MRTEVYYAYIDFYASSYTQKRNKCTAKKLQGDDNIYSYAFEIRMFY